MLRDIRNLFENEEKENFWSNKYIESESNGDRSKDNDEEQVQHSKSDNIEIMMNGESDEVIKEKIQLRLDIKII